MSYACMGDVFGVPKGWFAWWVGVASKLSKESKYQHVVESYKDDYWNYLRLSRIVPV
jgi:hypothetical protein